MKKTCIKTVLIFCFFVINFVTVSSVTAGEGDNDSNVIMTNGDFEYRKSTQIYKQVGACDIRVDIYSVDTETVRPAIMFIHGGALIFGSRQLIRQDQVAMYLKAGFTLFSVDYRLAPEVKINAIIEDIRDAYSWIRTEGASQFSIDPDKIVVIGGSAGGYLTLMSGFIHDPAPKALVSFYGYGDIAGKWYNSPDPHYSKQKMVTKAEADACVLSEPVSEAPIDKRWKFYMYCRQNGLWPIEVAGYDAIEEPEKFYPYCPLRNVTENYPPTMLLHGDIDTDVPYEQSLMMAEKLSRHKVKHELIVLKGRGHVFDEGDRKMKDPEVIEVFERAIEFIQEQTK